MLMRPSADKKRTWNLGLANMLRKELGVWWGTRKWIVQSLAWTLVITGSVTFVLYVFTTLPVSVKPDMLNCYGMGAAALQVFFNVSGFACVMGVIISAHDLIINERLTGTAEWVFSKPLSRKAFVISKLIAGCIGFTAVIIILQAVLFNIVVRLFGGTVDLIPFMKGLALIWLICMFYLGLLLFLGTVTASRGMVLGCSFLFFLTGNLVPLRYPESYYLMPWKLSDIAFSVSLSIAWSSRIVIPVIMTVLWTVLLIIGSLRMIEKVEI